MYIEENKEKHRNEKYFIGEVHVAVIMKTAVILVQVYGSFRGSCYLHREGSTKKNCHYYK